MERGIVNTRLLVPRPREGYIARQGLLDTLEALPHRRLTVVQGGPGSGKTTLLAAYLQGSGLPARWITLGAECSRATLFWEYMARALDGLLDAGAFAEYLQAGRSGEPKEAARVLLNAIPQRGEFALVLDDFHLLRGKALLESIGFFIEGMPPNMHLVLLSREKPGLYLAGYELRGELLYIGEDALALTQEEGLRFLQQTLRVDLPEERLRMLADKAEGWIGGLQLLAAAKGDGSFARGGALREYIATEIFNGLTQVEQEFLVLTAVPRYWGAEVARGLLPALDFAQMLAGLLGRNLLLHCIDEARGLYQYHSLLREYLLGRFEGLEQERKEQVYRTLAEAFHKLGDEEESLRLLLAAGEYPLAMERILAMRPSAARDAYMLEMPVHAAMGSLDFAFQKFFCHYFVFEFAACGEIYELARAKEGFEAFVGVSAFIQIQSMHSGESAEVLARLAADAAEERKLHPLTRALLHIKNAAFYYYHDHYGQALAAAQRSLAEQAVAEGFIRYFCLTLQSQICEEMGQLSRAIAIQEQVRGYVQSNKMLEQQHKPTYCITAAGLYMKQMRLVQAEETLQEAQAQARGGQLWYSYVYNKAELMFLTGQVDKAARAVNSLMAVDAYANMLTLAPLLKYLYKAGAMPPAMQEGFMAAFRAAPEGSLTLNSRLLCARLLAERDEQGRALAQVDEVLRTARKRESALKIIEASLQRLALMLERGGEPRRMADLLREALYYARADRILQPFYVEADTVSLAHRALGDRVRAMLNSGEKSFYTEVLRLCAVAESGPLSARERELLQAVAQGLSNAEIAGRLYISLPTVKTHLASIYRKLEVKGRVAAVEKARQAGMIE